MRSSITLFDDQYKFYKAFKSEKLLIAFVEYMFENIEPEWLSEQEKILFDSLRVRMDNQKKKASAGAKWWKSSHWGWRKQKTTKDETKNKQKTNKKQAKNKQEEDISYDILRDTSNDVSKDKEEVKVITLSNDNVETEVSNFWNKEINELITNLKGYANSLWIAYDNTKERYFAKFILTAKEYWDFCEKIWQSRTEFAVNIMKASIHINYWKWICWWPMKIYQNYSDVYNETLKFKNRNSKNLIQSF